MATLSWMVLQYITKICQKEGPIFVTNIPGKKCWERGCNIPSWALIPSSSHKEIVKQTLQNLMHYKSHNIIDFRCVLLKLEKHQNVLTLLWPSLTSVKEQLCFVCLLPSIIALSVLSKRLGGLRKRLVKEVW